MSPRKIAAQLNEERIPSPSGATWNDSTIRGNAKKGLTSQPHLGPKAASIARRRDTEEHGSRLPSEISVDDSPSVPEVQSLAYARKKSLRDNGEIWTAWLLTFALEREKARIEDSERIATEREVARKNEAAKEKVRISDARTVQEAHDNAAQAVHMAMPRGTLADVIARAQSDGPMEMPPGEDCEIDPETFEREASKTPFKDPIRVRARSNHRVRSRIG